MNRHLLSIVCAAAISAASVITTPVVAGQVALPGFGFGRVNVTSIKEARFRDIVRQMYDFSCGSAAVATLLSYHYDAPVDEQTVFTSMLEYGDEEKIRTKGFSLLDMKQYLQRSGLTANGFRESLDKLETVGIPAIVLINLRGYLHFVVIKGVTADEVLVGDPALGNKTYPRDEFEAMWNGILFVVTDQMQLAKATFNTEDGWKVRHKAPFGTALSSRNLSSITLLAPGLGEY